MTGTAYDRAVAAFEEIIGAPSQGAYPTPAKLIKQTGQHLTTGYRNTAALEAEQFLRRDASGVYLQGLTGIRTGLNAFGMGRLAPVMVPVLLRIREATQQTSFLAIIDGTSVHTGPYAVGRNTKRTRLDARYRLEKPQDATDNTPQEVPLLADGPDGSRRIHTLMVTVVINHTYQAVFGLKLNPSQPPEPFLAQELAQAAATITQ
ncbi:hypothetical protein ROLI_000220 [Roseobacter fucihabitans]|uniref:Uncharacterized protein n=1 Tax=Roseobacter fucihabitans TaxID=1537242 RepID=A0ABZ2BLC7_9RHOB|nr:hypothetical protein [Roseobacter litoralis]MBC6968192.1 hypothetical protein [Roseobacter litoralis]